MPYLEIHHEHAVTRKMLQNVMVQCHSESLELSFLEDESRLDETLLNFWNVICIFMNFL